MPLITNNYIYQATTELVAKDSSSKSKVADLPHVSREECARKLYKFILSGQLDPSMYVFVIQIPIKYNQKDFNQSFFPRSIINFGGFGGSVLDVVESFGPNKCLENTFMQGFIDCIRQDDVLYNPDSVINTLILNVNVGVIVSPQLCILLQLLLYKYIIPIKLFYFSRPF